MSRIIMLVPLDKNVGLSSISIGLIDFFNKKIFNKNSRNSILYFSCGKNNLNSTSLIINKYFSKNIKILKNTDFSTKLFNSSEYLSLINKIIEDVFKQKNFYQLILIEGLNVNSNIFFEEINYDIAQNLSAEVIFLANLNTNSFSKINEKKEKIRLILDKKKYKNILGVIFNKINSPFIEKKYNFIEKLNILQNIELNKKQLVNTKQLFKNNFPPVIAWIPWDKNINKIFIIDIYNFLNIKYFNTIHNITSILEHKVKKIIIFDKSIIEIFNKNYHQSLILVTFSRFNVFADILNANNKNKKIIGIILTEVFISKKSIMNLCKILIKKNIYIAFTKKSTIEILSHLQKFNFNICLKNKNEINQLKKYICSFFSSTSNLAFRNKHKIQTTYSPKEFCCHLKLLSKKFNKRIILPESYETRILQAVSVCKKNNIAECVLLGDSKKIYNIAKENNIDLDKEIEIINPILVRDQYVSRFLNLRKKTGINEFYARKKLKEDIILATLILESSKVDGLVSGSVNTTANTILPALQLIKTHSNASLVSSAFFILLPNQVLVYADCAININPNADELAQIAIQSANSLSIFGIEPRVAMLSYSTGNSGSGCSVEKVRKATYIVKKREPNLIIDGPIQYDAAVSETVFKIKSPNSPLFGAANVFIFPDLNSGNIAYKAVQRSTNAISIGPILQGLKKPVNDLSRGSSVEDIIYTIAFTAIQSA